MTDTPNIPNTPNNPNMLGRFSLGERIAAGGMASVHSAAAPVGDRLHGFPLALKVLHDHLADETDFVRMFRDEGKIASRMAHPGVVRVYEVGEAQGQHYIAMERVDGYNLAQLLNAMRGTAKRFPSAAVFSILRQILGALAYVHGFSDKRGRNIGIVHRDISPQNILIGRDERVRIADFGIARGDHRADRTRTGTVKGKLHYMAPEQARGKRVDARADLYALGAVAFELWTRQPLHGADKTEVVHERAARGAIDFTRPEFKKLHKTVQVWLMTALAPEPDDRFANALDMTQALENVNGASKARFKPGTLSRVLTAADAWVADPARKGSQFLFSSAEMAQTTRKSQPQYKRPLTPQRAISGAFVGVESISRRGSQTSRRLTETHGAPDDWENGEWEGTPPPMPAASRLRKRRASAEGLELPVERVIAKTGVSRRQRRASLSQLDAAAAADIGDEPASAAPTTAQAKRRRRSKSKLPESPGDSIVNPRPPNSNKPSSHGRRGPTRVRVEKLEVVDQQRSLAAASVVMWASAALLLFAMLLEAWNARVDFPNVDEQTFVAWFSDEPQAASTERPVKPAAEPPKRWPTKLPDVRNDRFLPRDAVPSEASEKPAPPRLATAPTEG